MLREFDESHFGRETRRRWMDFEIIEAFLPEELQLLGNGQLCNLDLSIEGERFEDDLVCKAAHELRPEGSGELAQH